MQVEALEPGFAWAAGRGERRRVNIALVSECELGDWLLVFIESARERISAERAREIESALDLLEAALRGAHTQAQAAANFTLPSSLSAEELARLTGRRR
jgi:hydrogenase expression/formation protein HypC